LLRRYTTGEKSEVDDVLWNGDGVLSPRRSLGTSVISEIVIGMGASLGKEAAPKLMGGVAGSVLGRRIRVPRAPCGRAVSATPWMVGRRWSAPFFPSLARAGGSGSLVRGSYPRSCG
jgi:hypothetical protein